jgi:hypothetical protein
MAITPEDVENLSEEELHAKIKQLPNLDEYIKEKTQPNDHLYQTPEDET